MNKTLLSNDRLSNFSHFGNQSKKKEKNSNILKFQKLEVFCKNLV